jgi:hypothetical protein
MDAKIKLTNKLLKKQSRRAQITFFIIIALIIIVAVALTFLLIKKPLTTINPEENIVTYVQSCVDNSLIDIEKNLLENNGYENITKNFILYSKNEPNEKVPYLCKASQFYFPCINQEPMFGEMIRQEIKKQATKEAQKCFTQINDILEKKGYAVNNGNLNLDVNLVYDTIGIEINKKITVKKDSESRVYENFNTQIKSPLHQLISTLNIILNYESTLCEFDNVNWMRYYPKIKITKFITSDQTKVYTLTDKDSNKKISFAVRTCVLPAGI